jgi:adenine deaminase
VIPFGNTWTVEGNHNAAFLLMAEEAGSPLQIFPAIGSTTPPNEYESGGGYYGYQEMTDFMDSDVHATQQLGSMDFNIRNAIEAVVKPAIAYVLGSYNTARHFNIDYLIGSVAPGRYADLVFLTDVEKVVIEFVIANDKVASKGRECLLLIPKINYPDWAKETFNVGRVLTASDFTTSTPANRTTVIAALMQPFYFAADFMAAELPVTERVVIADPNNAISKVAVIDRYHGKAATSKMFWKNVGSLPPVPL